MPLRANYEDDPSQLPPPRVPVTVPTGGAAPAPTGGGEQTAVSTPSGGGGGGGFQLPSFNFHAPNAPGFNAPVFAAPTMADAQNEPGYQFRLGAGTQALDHSAAAKGSLRGGNTLKDILEYGQNFAGQEYQNVYNRAMQGFQQNYQGAKDEYAPKLATWQQNAEAQRQAALMGYQGSVSNALTQSQPHYAPEPDYSAILGPAPMFPDGGDAGYQQMSMPGNGARATSRGWDDPERYY